MVSYRSESHRIYGLILWLLLATSIEVEAQVTSDPSLDAGTSTPNAQTADTTNTATASTPAPGQATTPPALPAAGQAPPLPAVPDQRLEVYGYVMTDLGYNFQTIDPNWFDVMRPTKLPSFRGEFGRDGRTFAG